MRDWDQRPYEIRNLFNPAFCGLLLMRSFRAYELEDERGMPFSLALLVLPLSLHKQSREILDRGKRSYLLKLLSAHPELLVGFSRRVSDLLPYTQEALGFLMQLGLFEVTNEGRLKPTSDGVKKAMTGTKETVSCQKAGKFIGREFARIGDRSTVYMSLGIRP